MTSERRIVVEHTFRGGRFEDHGMDVDALQEIVRYKGLVVELTKDLWRARHPDRCRLPIHFGDELGLKIYEIVPNCVTLPLERDVDRSEQQSLFHEDDGAEDDLARAVGLIAEAIDAADNDQPLPSAFPKRLLIHFRDYGSSLHSDESIEQYLPGCDHFVRFDQRVRANMIRRMDSNYEATVDLVGIVTMARVNRPRMSVQLLNGQEIDAVFLPEHEADIVAALKDHETAKVQVVGLGQYSGTGELQRISEVQRVVLLPHGEIPFDSSAKPIWAKFQEIVSILPADAFDGVPKDGASHHDAYL